MTDLCSTFKRLARRVWRDRADGLTLGLDPSEPTFTEDLLLTLARKHRSQVTIRKFTQRKESLVGADWEWWFQGDPLGFRVQAKKHHAKEMYDGVAYQGTTGTVRQIDTLIAMASKYGTRAMYCFYNHWSHLMTPVDPDNTSRRLLARERPLWGCSLAHANDVLALLNTAGTKRPLGTQSIVDISFPWHWLVCRRCPPPQTSAATSKTRGLLAQWLGERHRHQATSGGVTIPIASDPRGDSAGQEVNEPPSYVRALFEEERPNTKSQLEEGRERLLAGFVYFRSPSTDLDSGPPSVRSA